MPIAALSQATWEWFAADQTQSMTYDVAYLSSKTIIATGDSDFDHPGTNSPFVASISQSGAENWKRNYSFGDSSSARALEMGKGMVVIAGEGYHNEDNGIDGWIAGIDTTNGDTLWFTWIGGEEKDGLRAVVSAPDSGWVATGYTFSNSVGFGADIWLVKFDRNGKLLWERNYGSNAWDIGNDLAMHPDSGWVISGWTATAGNKDGYILKTNPKGFLEKQLVDFKNGEQEFYSVCINNSNEILASGKSELSSGRDAYAMLLNSDLDMAWSKSYGTADIEVFRGCQVDGSGNFVLAGEVVSGTKSTALLLKLDALGDTVLSSSPAYATARAVDVSKDGGFIIGGAAYNRPALTDAMVVRLNTTGVGKESLVPEPKYKIFPNPAGEWLYLPDEVNSWMVFDLHGKILDTGNSPQSKIHLNTVKPGIYILKMFLKNGKMVNRKFSHFR